MPTTTMLPLWNAVSLPRDLFTQGVGVCRCCRRTINYHWLIKLAGLKTRETMAGTTGEAGHTNSWRLATRQLDCSCDQARAGANTGQIDLAWTLSPSTDCSHALKAHSHPHYT